MTSFGTSTQSSSDKLRKLIACQAELRRRGIDVPLPLLAPPDLETNLPLPGEEWERYPDGSSLPTLEAFVHRTASFRLDPWQQVLCARLQRLAGERGQRLLIHAPPQHGKSVILSQRFPAWYLGLYPTARIKIACYNITHATGFASIVRDLVQSSEYQEMFPQPSLRVLPGTRAESWSTLARLALRDAQPSVKALGLVSGFTGHGADLLLVDDPYASPQDAFSELVNRSVQLFWEQGAKTRIAEDANVAVMFHRYQEADYAGYLIEREGLIQDGGRWELLRFPAVGDEYRKWPDALGRTKGEGLSPRYSEAYYAEMALSPAWLGQFQGLPTAPEGSFFKVGQFEFDEVAPAGLTLCRAWDLAATAGGGDYTRGVLIGVDRSGRWFVVDVVGGQWGPDDVARNIRLTAGLDGTMVAVRLPQDPAQAGKSQALQLTRLLAGYNVTTGLVSGDKSTRAFGFAAQVNGGNVRLVRGAWNREYIEELRQFPGGRHDDQVDASSDAFNELALGAEPVVVSNYVSGSKRPRSEF